MDPSALLQETFFRFLKVPKPQGFCPCFYDLTTIAKLFRRHRDPIAAWRGVVSIEYFILTVSLSALGRLDDNFVPGSNSTSMKSAPPTHSRSVCFPTISFRQRQVTSSWKKRVTLEEIEIIRHLTKNQFNVLTRFLAANDYIEKMVRAIREDDLT